VCNFCHDCLGREKILTARDTAKANENLENPSGTSGFHSRLSLLNCLDDRIRSELARLPQAATPCAIMGGGNELI
jgi:hypothetical protein